MGSTKFVIFGQQLKINEAIRSFNINQRIILMDLREAKLILEKINRLFESMSLDERKIDSFEQDLMLSYTKQFHDAFKYKESQAMPQPIKRKAAPEIVAEPVPVVQKAKPPKPVVKEVPVVQEAPVIKEAPIIKQAPVIKEAAPIREVVVEKAPKVEAAPAVVAATPVAVSQPAQSAPPKPVVVKKSSPTLAPNMAALFEFQDSNELSHKLSQQPIADLTKAISINERILTINDLFDKDAVFYTEILKKINNLGSFDDAQLILVQLAQKFDWIAEDKKKKAKIFIRLVRRRFL